jgi:lipopolysaccharide/colanic/teichoic acid biosynthesis glycosyltransferase
MSRYVIAAIDLIWLGIAPVAALLIRDNFEISDDHLISIQTYMLINLPVAAAVFFATGVHRGLWHYASLQDLRWLAISSAGSILLTVLIAYHFGYMEGIARSVPVIQWFLVIVGLSGLRVAGRWVRERLRQSIAAAPASRPWTENKPQHVLVLGLNRLTELYLEAAALFSPQGVTVVGILADGGGLLGRQVKFHEIVGTPEDLPKVLAKFENHGIAIDRIVLTVPLADLSEEASRALSAARGAGLEIDALMDRFVYPAIESVPAENEAGMPAGGGDFAGASAPYYPRLKRAFDFTVAALLLLVLSPLAVLAAVVVALDVGLPVMFWQQRPGRYGKPFKVYKFRTMRKSHDAAGNRIPDEERLSVIGKVLRKFRLDELPQLYNIAAGQMSFVGPRPLLASEQVNVNSARLVVRPGLTGWAQVNGGRNITVEEKAALDLWYIARISPWLDIAIALRTLRILVTGDRPNRAAVRLALKVQARASGAAGIKPKASGNPEETKTPKYPTSAAAE